MPGHVIVSLFMLYPVLLLQLRVSTSPALSIFYSCFVFFYNPEVFVVAAHVGCSVAVAVEVVVEVAVPVAAGRDSFHSPCQFLSRNCFSPPQTKLRDIL